MDKLIDIIWGDRSLICRYCTSLILSGIIATGLNSAVHYLYTKQIQITPFYQISTNTISKDIPSTKKYFS